LVEDHHLDRVDFIKMDIEGAEQEALRGATGTPLRFRPRLAIASYHREDDFEAIPAIIRGGSADYAMTCGPCAPSEHDASVMIPHMTYYE
ncbi:MAG: hypothetical protein GY953_15895, partial [bacterium]|nr:hypothetical protein [bacterium]